MTVPRYSQSSMLNTEMDAVVSRGEQKRSFSPGRVVGGNFPAKPPSNFSSSPLSTSPLGQLWGSESSFYSASGEDSSATAAPSTASSFNFGNRYSGNIFNSNFYTYIPTAEDGNSAEVDNVDMDVAPLDLGPDFDGEGSSWTQNTQNPNKDS